MVRKLGAGTSPCVNGEPGSRREKKRPSPLMPGSERKGVRLGVEPTDRKIGIFFYWVTSYDGMINPFIIYDRFLTY